MVVASLATYQYKSPISPRQVLLLLKERKNLVEGHGGSVTDTNEGDNVAIISSVAHDDGVILKLEHVVLRVGLERGQGLCGLNDLFHGNLSAVKGTGLGEVLGGDPLQIDARRKVAV